MWGDVDPNIFYICDAQTQTPLQLRCPEGRGFFNGLGYKGCIPFEQWPACLKEPQSPHYCDGEHMTEPWETINPNKFFLCLREMTPPALVNCELGKGFVNMVVDSTTGAKIVGCARWQQWREYMNCTQYY